jgi:hypothetical protein
MNQMRLYVGPSDRELQVVRSLPLEHHWNCGVTRPAIGKQA